MGPTQHETETPRRRRRGVLVLLLAGSLTAMIGAGTMSIALFTDSDAVAGTFNAGTVVIDATPADLVFDEDPLMPGDSTQADVNVANTGTGDLRYAMATTTSGALASGLGLTVYEGTCAEKGTSLGRAALDGYGFGSSATGAQTGDRTLAAAASEDFCFVVDLPLGAGNEYQDKSATATFTFSAEQTANN
jgi:hypothetical protein